MRNLHFLPFDSVADVGKILKKYYKFCTLFWDRFVLKKYGGVKYNMSQNKLILVKVII